MKNLSEIASFYWVIPIIILIFLTLLWVEDRKEKKPILIAFFLLYFAVYSYLVFFYRIPIARYRLNATLFHTYQRGFDGLQIKNLSTVRQIILNILLYIPLGMMLSSASRGRKLFSLTTGIIISVATEAIQYFSRRGYADIDDLFNNMIGCILGILLFVAIVRIKHKKQPQQNPE